MFQRVREFIVYIGHAFFSTTMQYMKCFPVNIRTSKRLNEMSLQADLYVVNVSNLGSELIGIAGHPT